MEKIRVLIADDSPVARNMLIRMLKNEDDIEIAGEADTGQSVVKMLDEAAPDVILLEASISGGISVPRLASYIKDIKPRIRVILCAEVSSDSEVIKEAEPWASDIIRKPYNKTNLLRAIREYDLF